MYNIMQDFELYKSRMLSEGLVASHQSVTPLTVNDQIQDGEIVTIPKNVTFFAQEMPSGNVVEFVVFPNENGQLRRLYMSWFKNNPSDVLENMMSECQSYDEFFKHYENLKLKVNIEMVEEFNRETGVLRRRPRYFIDVE